MDIAVRAGQSVVFVSQLPNSRGQNHDRDTYSLQQERDVEFSELRVTLWHDSPGMADNVFLGEVKIPLRGLQQQQFAASNKWSDIARQYLLTLIN
jgi:hypothetical protein